MKEGYELIINEDFIQIDTQIDEVVQAIHESRTYKDYIDFSHKLYADEEVAHLMAQFKQKKAAFEKIEAYGKYAPDFRQTQREAQRAKRKLDLHPVMTEFRFAETSFQGLLDELCLGLANDISETIKVDAGNPFFEKRNHTCGGHCHVS